MKIKLYSQEAIHHSAAVCGGFFGAYAILNRHENFGSSATSNLIIILTDLIGTSFKTASVRIFAILLYITAIILTVVISKKTSFNVKKISLAVNFAAAVILFFLPEKMNYILSLYPVFFAMAFQWNSFIGPGNLASSTIFSTNNLRVTVSGYITYLINKDTVQLEKANFYALTLLFFHAGVVYGYIGYRLFGVKSSVFIILPLIISYILIRAEENSEKVSHAVFSNQNT